MYRVPKLKPPTVLTTSTFKMLDGLLNRWLNNRTALDSLKDEDTEIRAEIEDFISANVDRDNRSPFPGIVIQMRSSYSYDVEAAEKWAKDDQNISGAASMLQVDEAGMLRLIAVILTTDPDTAERLKDCLTINHQGYVAALSDQTHAGMPPFTRDDVPVLAITKQNVKVGAALEAELLIVADPAPEEAATA